MKKSLKILSAGLMMMLLSSCTTLHFNLPSILNPLGGDSQSESTSNSQSSGNGSTSNSESSDNNSTSQSSSNNNSSSGSSSGNSSSSGSGNSSSGSSSSSGGSSQGGGENDKAKYTIMIYLCGSNLESGYDSETGKTNVNNASLATGDIEEILSVSNQPNDVNIIIETGGAKAWNTKYGISSSKLGRWHVENKKLVKDTELTYASMGLASTFQSFLEWGLTSYPAEKTGVILWNHGGAMGGVCYDEKKNDDSLYNSEVSSAVQAAFTNTGTDKLEWIGYDACLMAVQDVADFNSKYFNYMVCAQESEAGEGWDYDTWVDDLYAGKSTETILRAICDGFVQAYQTNYSNPYNMPNDQTLSFLNLNNMATYKSAFETLAKNMSSKVSSYGKSNFQKFFKNNVKFYGSTRYSSAELQEYADYYGCTVNDIINEYSLVQGPDGFYYEDYGYDYFGVFDAMDFLNELSKNSSFSSLSSDISTVKNALSNLIVYNKAGADAGDSNGLSIFFPLSSNCGKSVIYTTSQTNFTNWRSIVNSYGA